MVEENLNRLNLSPDECLYLQRRLKDLVFNDAITRLSIFQRGQRLQNALSASALPTRLRKSSMARTRSTSVESDTMPPSDVLNAIKLDKELEVLIRMYTLAQLDLQQEEISDQDESVAEQGSLYAAVEAHRDENSDADKVMAESQQLKDEFKALKSQIETEKVEAIERMAAYDERIAILQHDLRNMSWLNELELRLVHRWEEVRFSQAQIVDANEERDQLRRILALERRIAGETRIIAEVRNYRQQQFEDFRKRIAEWQERYAAEMAVKQAETQAHERLIAKLDKDYERHHETYEQRVNFVNIYLAEKAEEQRLYELELRRVQSAVQIQSWWRGCLVRHGLGPFKKKPKKGKKGKGKGK